MSKVDGLEFLAHVKENYPETPCFVITAHGTPEIEEKLSKSTLHIFHKPFRIDDLANAVIQVFEQDAPDGTLKGISVASFLQLIQMEEKTCCLEIMSTGDEKGLFYFKDGELYDAFMAVSAGKKRLLSYLPLRKQASA